jgi:cytochrome c oxidase subunit 4
MTEHAPRPPAYFVVFACLIALTLLTVAASFQELGTWHTAVGVAIGVVKALLVVLFFMHLWGSPRLSWLAIGAGLFWLGILLALTLSDYLTRKWSYY